LSYRKKAKQEYVQARKASAAKTVKTQPFPYGKPRKISPMLAEQGTPEDIEMLHDYDEQRKYDGTRAFIIKSGDKVVLRGRSWINDYAPKFPELVAEIKQLPVEACVLDSELTFFKKGTDKDVFVTALANPETKKDYTAKLMVFDALFVEDYDLEKLPFSDRREIIEKIVPGRLRHIEAVETVEKNKKAFFQSLKAKQGEGVMLKERKSPYREGERTREWLKVKHWKSDEAVIVGYTKGEKSRASTFGAVILAQRDKNGKWRYVGKAAGFKEKELGSLLGRMRKIETKNSPVVDAPSDVNVKAWVKPQIVAEIKYYEKTENGLFRFPDYVRERDDKKPEECKI
jgi:bifunctional non-homologous end joining protein LigD